MFPFVVADIGGTNARFALVTGKKNGVDAFSSSFDIENIEILKGADFDSFEAAMKTYLDSTGCKDAKGACVAIAGPTDKDQVSMTNLPWSFSQEALRKIFDLNVFAAINDYTALAIATSQIDSAGLESVISGERDLNGNKAIFGPGSGLGVAGLARGGKTWLPIISEGGHANMAPSNELESDVLRFLIKKYGHVSAEMCLSGPGIENLYEALCALHGEEAKALRAADISSAALENSDKKCHCTLSLFCAFLGTMAGNLVLTYGAKGGAYITGGIVPRFVDFLRESEFEARFKNKGVMSKYLDGVPVDVVVHEHSAFLGAAAWMDQLVN
jgi:glucokinase